MASKHEAVMVKAFSSVVTISLKYTHNMMTLVVIMIMIMMMQ